MSTQAGQVVDTTFFDHEIDRRGTASLKWDRYRDSDILPFWVADMDFAMAPPIHEALKRRLDHPVIGYTVAPDGLAPAIIEHLSREFDWQVLPDWFVWLPGVVPGLAAACRAFADTGDAVLVNPPIYHHFFDAHEPRHELLEVPLTRLDGRWTYDIEAMRAALTDRTRLLLLCSPHNPVGTVFRAEELQAIMALAEERELVVISDEIHCDLVINESVCHLPTACACPDSGDRLITLMSASKTWNLAGLNCSFAIIADRGLRERFKSACDTSLPVVPPLAYVATEAAYRDGEPWRQALLEQLRGNLACLERFCAGIDGLELQPLDATYLAWIDARGLGLNETPQAFFERHGVGLSAGEQFGEPGYLRLNFACPRSQLERGLDRMAQAVAKLQN